MITPPLKTSTTGRKLIEDFEGCILHAYDDGTGVLTIGYGHTTDAGLPRVRAGMTITKEQADAILSADLAAVENDVNHHVTALLAQQQFDALVSFDFNTGALDRSNVLRSVNAKAYAQAANDLLMWDHAKGRVLAGLLRRREAERTLFLSATPAATPPSGI
jgi:lysozyme